jgi:hypothetical protein
MSALTPYLVVVWVVVMVGVFPSFHPRRSVLLAVLGGALFLPELRDELALGPFHFSKGQAISYAALLGALLYDSERLLSGRPRWVDVPMVLWCLCPLPSVLTNDPPPDGSPPLRDALSQTWTQVVTFGIPYLLGRVYFSDPESLRELALGVVIAALVYSPLCVFESRMSPQLHRMVYGYMQHEFAQTIRLGGYRPMVFMQHGLALGLFISSAALVATWMWWAGGLSPRRPAGTEGGGQSGYIPLVLLLTNVLVKSTGAFALGCGGGAVLWLARATGSRWWLLLLTAVPVAYVAARATGEWSGNDVVTFIAENVGADRASSLKFRFDNEDLLAERATLRPAFGWGGWGRARVFDEETGRDQTTTDGYWIIVLGDRGGFGLAALGAALLLPVVRFAFLFPPARWDRRAAPAAALTVVLALWTIDSLLNAMLVPIYIVIAGAVTGLRPQHFHEQLEAGRTGEPHQP